MPKRILIELETRVGTEADAKLKSAFADQFQSTANPARFWVDGRRWGQRIESLWNATLQPNGIPAEITSILGMGRAMTEEEWQFLLKNAGIEETLCYSVVATDWGQGDICACPMRGVQFQDEPGPQVTEEDAVAWVFPQ